MLAFQYKASSTSRRVFIRAKNSESDGHAQNCITASKLTMSLSHVVHLDVEYAC
uniref:Uncharacterized protein n=1 Tax=Anguilla anguilla TaxID=7936 RepID=A0A0E9XPJ1_ANGAN